jgi:hypothetical protein
MDTTTNNTPLTPQEIAQLTDLWSRARALFEQRNWDWQRACHQATEPDEDLGFNLNAENFIAYGLESIEYRDQCNRDASYYSGNTTRFHFPLELLAMGEGQFKAHCDQLEAARLASERLAAEAAASAAQAAAEAEAAKSRATQEARERSAETKKGQ